jgi:hypothetical protein
MLQNFLMYSTPLSNKLERLLSSNIFEQVEHLYVRLGAYLEVECWKGLFLGRIYRKDVMLDKIANTLAYYSKVLIYREKTLNNLAQTSTFHV